QQPDLFFRKTGAVCPDSADQVLPVRNSSVFLYSCHSKTLSGIYACCAAVKADHTAFWKLFLQKFIQCITFRFCGSVKCNAAAVKLMFSLNKISAVCPQPRFIQRNCCYAGRSCKTRNKLAAFKKLTDIFTLMIIICRHNVNIYILTFHLAAQSYE